jgi:hypothetical protein
MKRVIIVLLLPVLLFVLGPAVTHAAPSNNPVFATVSQVHQLINTALAPIQSQLTGLNQRLTAVESSPPSRTYVLVDSSNQELGILVDGFAIGEQKTIYNEEFKKFITFHASSGQVSPSSNLFYPSNNCTGDAYVEGPWLNDHIFRVGSSARLAAVDTSIAPATVAIHSYSDGENCAPFSDNEGNAYRANIVQPYSQPVNPLFHIKVQ